MYRPGHVVVSLVSLMILFACSHARVLSVHEAMPQGVESVDVRVVSDEAARATLAQGQRAWVPPGVWLQVAFRNACVPAQSQAQAYLKQAWGIEAELDGWAWSTEAVMEEGGWRVPATVPSRHATHCFSHAMYREEVDDGWRAWMARVSGSADLQSGRLHVTHVGATWEDQWQATSTRVQGTMERTVDHNGMHHTVSSTVRVQRATGCDTCSVAMLETIDARQLVDLYRVDELARFGGPTVHAFRDINLEWPSAACPAHVLVAEMPLQAGCQATLTYPTMVRYQSPSNDSDMAHMDFHTAPVFLRCEGDVEWAPVALKSLSMNGEDGAMRVRVDVPVGQLPYRKMVNNVTGVVTVGAALVVLLWLYLQTQPMPKQAKLE